ncbi:NAD(P)-binding protein [Thozetella sp. PMI_491]|nr:NAD(P)-binding protein [Thozetella sp. PMI_491]
MTSNKKLVWFVTGANSGLGLCIVKHALFHGHTVVATARSLSKFPQSLKENPNADLVELEIAGPSSAATAILDAAVLKHGRIDVLVNNAGYGLMGAVEDLTEAEIRYQFDVNVFGLINVTKAALPHMRKQGSGTIIQMSSVGGFFAIEGSPVYLASKFAVEGLTEGLALEVKRFDIRVHLVEPGFFRTNFLVQLSKGKNVAAHNGNYMDVQTVLSGVHGNQPGDPQKAAECIHDLVMGVGLAKGLEEELRIPLGSDCVGMMGMKAKALEQTAQKLKSVAESTDFELTSSA